MTEKDKAHGKIDIKIGNISFSAEGEQVWLGEQLTKVMEAASTLPAAKFEPAGEGTPAGGTSSEKTREATGDTLAAYLKAKGGENKQVQRFLATAGWLYRRNEKELSPTAVAKALSRNHQKGLANAADCLNQNVGKGYCEKTEGNKFFITHDGWKQLGEQE
jgi:hypothetical protein